MDALLPLLVPCVAALALAAVRLPAGGAALDAVLAPAVGFGALSLSFFTWRFSGLSSASFAPFAWASLGAITVWAALRLRRRGPRAATGGLRRGPPLLLLGVFAACAVLLGVAFAAWSRQVPVGQFDAWAIWSSRARLLFRAEDPAVAFGLLRRAHPDYPLLLPGTLAALFALAGEVSFVVPRWTGALFAVAGPASLGVGLRRLGTPPAWAWAGGVLLLATPLWTYWGFAQCADVPLAYLTTAAATALALRLRDGDDAAVSAPLAGFLAGLPAWTKNEGMILSLLILALFAAWTLARGPSRRGLVPVAVGAAVPWAAGLLFRIAWKPTSDLGVFLESPWVLAARPERWRLVGGAFLERLDPIGGFASWGLVWTLAAVGLVVTLATTGRRREVAFLALLALLSWATWFGVFVATPLDLEWHLRTALDRLMLQLLPLTLLAAFSGLRIAREGR